MTVDTLNKIAQQCKGQFVSVQAGETHPYIEEILINIKIITCVLKPLQLEEFYEGVGHIISA